MVVELELQLTGTIRIWGYSACECIVCLAERDATSDVARIVGSAHCKSKPYRRRPCGGHEASRIIACGRGNRKWGIRRGCGSNRLHSISGLYKSHVARIVCSCRGSGCVSLMGRDSDEQSNNRCDGRQRAHKNIPARFAALITAHCNQSFLIVY